MVEPSSVPGHFAKLRKSPVWLLAFFLLLGTSLVVPNGTELRFQRYVNLQFIALAALGAYALSVSVTAGLLILYTDYLAFNGIGFDVLALLVLLSAFFIYMATQDWSASRGKLYDVLCIIAGINLVWQILQMCGIYLLMTPVAGKTYPGLMGNIDETCALYLICLPAFFRRRRWPLMLVIPLGAAVAKVWEWGDEVYRIWEHIAGRLETWRVTLGDMGGALFTGHGFAKYAVWNARTHEWFTESHNEFVEWVWRAGIVGVALGTIFAFVTIKKGVRQPDRIPVMGFIAACISALGFFTWHIVPLSLLTVFYLGLIYSGKVEQA